MATTKTLFKVRDTVSGKFIYNYRNLQAISGKEYKTEDAARAGIAGYISYSMGYKCSVEKARELADNIKVNFEIVKYEVVQKEVSTTSASTHTKNTLLSQHLYGILGYKYHYFWDHAIRKNFADSINYVFLLEQKSGQDYMTMIKEARASLRNLGVKTRTFREHNGCFGFYNKDQALKARLTLDVKSFIDIEELRQQLFGK